MIDINFSEVKTVTMVGSRDILPAQRDLFLCLGKYFTDQYCETRSGLAEGSDLASFMGSINSINYDPGKVKNYVVSKKWWHDKFAEGTIKPLNKMSIENRELAKTLALDARGSFAGLNDWGIGLHTRNAFQILGDELKEPSDLLIFCSKPVGKNPIYSKVSGGTNTAFQIGCRFKVPFLNLYVQEDFALALQFLMKQKAKFVPDIEWISEYEYIKETYYPKY